MVQRWFKKCSEGDTSSTRRDGSRGKNYADSEVLRATVEANPSTSVRKM